MGFSMFVVIPAAGKGTRLYPITLTTPKPLIPLLGEPLIVHIMKHLEKLNITDFFIVYNEKLDLFKKATSGYQRVTFVKQENRHGLAHAIAVALENSPDDSFIVHLPDNIFHKSWIQLFRSFDVDYFDAVVVLAEVSDPKRFGVAIIEDGKIMGFIEKPNNPPSNLVLTGLIYFRDKEEYLKCFKEIKPSYRGEYEITDILNCYIRNGRQVGYIPFKRWWIDVGTPASLLQALKLLLNSELDETRIEGDVYGEVHGKVWVKRGSVIEGSVYGPAYIGENVYVDEDSVVSYSDLEDGSSLKAGLITNSLILEGVTLLLENSSITNSIIGRRSMIQLLNTECPNLVISDFSTITIKGK